MKMKLLELIKRDKFYLAIVLSLCCCLFIMGYQYIHRINGVEPAPAPKSEKKVLFSTTTYSISDNLLEIKMGRDRERSRDWERIQKMLEQPDLSVEVKKEAERELWRINQVAAKENELENMLKANGFRDCLVTIGEKVVTVVIAGKLQSEEAKTVGEISAEVSGVMLDRVRIVEHI